MGELQKTDSLQALPIHLLSLLSPVTTWFNRCISPGGKIWKEIIIMVLEVSFLWHSLRGAPHCRPVFFTLLASLVNLAEELVKDLLLEAVALVHLGNVFSNVAHLFLFVCVVDLVELQFVVQSLDLGLVVLVLSAVVLLENGALVLGGALQSLVHQPTALVVLDIGTDFAEGLGVGKVVEVVVLDLEVFTHGDEDVVCLLEVLFGSHTAEVQSQSDGEIEGVVCSLVDNDESVFLQTEVVEVDVVFRGGQQIASLAQLGLEGDFVEQLHQVDVVAVLAEVLLEQDVNGALEHKSIVDGNHADVGHEVPARRTTAGLGRVHDVVRDEEEGLQQLNHPAESGGAEVLVVGEIALEEQSRCVDDRHAAVALAADCVVLERLFEPCQGLSGEVVLLAVFAQVLDELREDRLELFEGDRHVGGGGARAQRV
jgi:hypothetical protein